MFALIPAAGSVAPATPPKFKIVFPVARAFPPISLFKSPKKVVAVGAGPTPAVAANPDNPIP